MSFVETSAKTGFNVEKAFTTIAQQIYEKIESAEFKVQDGWDGIRTGGFSRTDNAVHLMEAEPARDRCC